MSHVVRRPGPTEPRGRGGCVPGRPCGGCRSPAATGKHLTCDPRTCGQERGAARGLDGGGCAGVPGDIQPQCPQNLAQLLAPHLPAGPCKLDARSVWAGSPPSPAPVLCLGPQPWPRTWRSLGILVSEVRVRHGWRCVRRVHPTGPCCQSPYSPRCLGWAHVIPGGPGPGPPQTPCACQEAPAVALLRADQTAAAGGPAPLLPGTRPGDEEGGSLAACEACGSAVRTEAGAPWVSALAPGAVGLTVTALGQLPGTLEAVQLQEGGDELGDGFHVTGPGRCQEEGRVTTVGMPDPHSSQKPTPITPWTIYLGHPRAPHQDQARPLSCRDP